MAKAMLTLQKAYWNAKNKITTLKEEESGMETLEVVILIVIAVVLAILVLNFLTGDGTNEGIVQKIFNGIGEKLEQLFSIKPASSASDFVTKPST